MDKMFFHEVRAGTTMTTMMSGAECTSAECKRNGHGTWASGRVEAGMAVRGAE